MYQSECKKAQRRGWDELRSLPGGGGLGLGLESLLGLEKAKKTKEDWLWWGEIGSGEKNDVSKDAEARSALSWLVWNKSFCCGGGAGSTSERARLRRQHRFILEDPLRILIVLDYRHYFWVSDSKSTTHRILELERILIYYPAFSKLRLQRFPKWELTELDSEGAQITI